MKPDHVTLLAEALHEHWIDSIEKVQGASGRQEVYVVCTCGEWIAAPLDIAAGDPALVFSEHCASKALASLDRVEGETAPCWFCGRSVSIEHYLIAGYDTFDEQRLVCLDCDRTMKALRDKGYELRLAAHEEEARP